MEFSKSHQERYKRNIILDDIGTLGQMKLQEGKVLIIGAGGLGSAAALYLTAAGIGTMVGLTRNAPVTGKPDERLETSELMSRYTSTATWRAGLPSRCPGRTATRWSR